MANERVTEDMVGDVLRKLGYYADPDAVMVEKQQSAIEEIRTALAKASKTGKGKAGYPEFIVTAPDTTDMVVVIECKAETAKHESANRDKPVEYAVDGALHYARHVSGARTVIAIAVSGAPKKNPRWSFFLIPKGESEPKPLTAPTGAAITSLVPMRDLIAAASFDPKVLGQRVDDLIAFSQEMHAFMRDEAELGEQEKPLAVAGSLIALSNDVFVKTYDAYPPEDLPKFWMQTIKDEMAKASIPNFKVDNMTQPFTTIQVHPELSKKKMAYPKGLLNEIVTLLADRVLPFMTVYEDFDIVGQFYGEFLKYTGGDGKGLGIVLTPRHVTELFALIANVNKDSVVVDPSAGTAGFLISAMVQMTKSATTEAQVASVRRDRLVGIEQKPDMYALAASNMILRGDGKANLHLGSCFEPALMKAVQDHKSAKGRKLRPTVGMINPPFAKSKEDLYELRFVDNMLDMLAKGGTGIAIVPVSCATLPTDEKRTLLSKHTLEGVMSMPPEVFHPVGVVTCIMVFTARIPHATSNKKSWFGYWRDDGFVKVKNLGRIDRDHRWPVIRERWIEQWRNREVHPGESVTAKVGPDDEWVAEAYMEADYSTLNLTEFHDAVRDNVLFTMKEAHPPTATPVNASSWRDFPLGKLFDIRKGQRVTRATRRPGTTRFVGASEKNNGVTDMCDLDPNYQGDCLTCVYNGNSVGFTFYQDQPFFACDDVNVLIPNEPMSRLAQLFIAAVIQHGRSRFTYGYKWTLGRMKTTTIRLPVTETGAPDYAFMEAFMQGLPFSAPVA